MQGLGDLNLSLILAAIGSAWGAGVAGMSAIGAWKKAYSLNKAAPFILVAFVGAPLSQTIYGMILRNAIKAAAIPDPMTNLLIGAFAGFAIGFSALWQGKNSAKACDALTETGQGFSNYIMVIGIIETVALFIMVFCLTALPKAA
ncbi:MAG: V-type ATP synthase subunit K [Candidatus Neomarinimicrobiota bacterium]